jgi:hypothetical protein
MDKNILLGTETGATLRDEGMATALEHTPEFFKSVANDVLLALAQHGEAFTVEDVRSRIGFDPPRRGTMGAIVAAGLKRNLIRSVGFVRAGRASSHRRYVQCFIGA